jgi:hypothetical protein
MKAKFCFSEGQWGMMGQCSNSLVKKAILHYENAIFATLTSKQASNNLL